MSMANRKPRTFEREPGLFFLSYSSPTISILRYGFFSLSLFSLRPPSSSETPPILDPILVSFFVLLFCSSVSFLLIQVLFCLFLLRVLLFKIPLLLLTFPLSNLLISSLSYVRQYEALIGTLTVEEQLSYSAELRYLSNVSREYKQEMVPLLFLLFISLFPSSTPRLLS